MTEPQRRKLIATGAIAVVVSLILYLIVFGLESFDWKGFLLLVGFFVMAAKIASIKRKKNPLL